MKALPVPDTSDVDRSYTELSRSRVRIAKRIKRDLPYLKSRFMNYEATCVDIGGNASPYAGDPTARREFIALYEKPPRCVRALKKHELLKATAECPYCCNSKAETFDHYLEKAVFPEYSLIPQNLVPVCWRCNPPNSSIVDGVVRKLHPYFSDVGSRAQLVCEFRVIVNAVEISVTLDAERLTKEEENSCVDHIKYLNLVDRFKTFAEAEYYNYGEVFINWTPADVERHLLTELASQRNYSSNRWRSVALLGMINSEGVIDAFCQGVSR